MYILPYTVCLKLILIRYFVLICIFTLENKQVLHFCYFFFLHQMYVSCFIKTYQQFSHYYVCKNVL